ncbi:phosphatidate cytidylyltransferase [[Leptolyngbya] sp. PCC 7376]|uniref:phosphatidate cytidylyltransferase n=1 Tax=[Leptolyngbya] sp. PCC 7376 TaxID=111781 RepID=UPI00029EE78E|nr:phosphatidate cytidylyltransferase [[Leptolyngbya] sp. PCC 7376]AFY40313.1 phosphatidate cytidylyltransferase [[Leptolyngbya] sp. PCC 7376]
MSLSRIISGVVAIAIALSLIILGGWYFTAGMAILVFLGQQEYFRMVRAKGLEPAAKSTLIVSQLLLIISTINPSLTDALFPLAGTFICFYLLFQTKMATIADMSTSILGLFYGGYMPSYWVRLRMGSIAETEAVSNLPLYGYLPESWTDWFHLPYALKLTFIVMVCIWAADIGAYVMGKWLGKTKLSAISPKKTVEGALFGSIGTISVAVTGAWYLGWAWWPITGMILGTVISVTTLLGDLTESIMKRDAGFKDSGQLIPGHGGILDRTDSYVFTAPLVYLFVTICLPMFTN